MVYPNARVMLPHGHKYIDELMDWKPDVIHSQCEFSTFVMARKIAKHTGAPIIHTYHTVYEGYTHYFCPSRVWGRKMVVAFSKLIASQTKAIVVPSAKISDMLDSEFDIKVENQKYHKNTNPAYFFRHLNHKVNSVQLRVAWSLMCWNMQSINIASHMAKVIHDKIESDNEIKNLDDIKKKVVGYNLNNEKNNLKTNGL